MLKEELYNSAKNHRIEKQYIADELIMAHGHQVLRLPPYHCQYNARGTLTVTGVEMVLEMSL